MNTSHTAVSVGSFVLGKGWTLGDALVMAAATKVDARRFGDDDQGFVESVLARYDGDSEALYPEAAELAAEGVELVVLAAAFDRGLSPEDFAELHNTYEAGALSGMLANFVEAHDEHVACPDPAERALLRIDGDRLVH